MGKKRVAAAVKEDSSDAKSDRGPKPIPLGELLEFANRIARFSRRFKEIADRSRQLDAGPLMATSFPSAKRGEELLTMFLTSLVAGLEELEQVADRNRDEFSEQRPDAKSSEQQVLDDAAKMLGRKGVNTPDQTSQ